MRNALITGATKGMGKAIATAFAAEDINVAVCARNAGDLEVFKSELLKVNPAVSVFTAVADGSNKAQLLQFAADAEKELGAIQIVVNNLGAYVYSSILEDDDETFEKLINTNLMPAWVLYRQFGKKMVAAQTGHFFNICSVAALNPIPEAGTYSITKAALLSLSKVMRLEMQQHGVKVTTVIPGSTLTDSWKGVEVEKDKMVMPEDVASAIVNILKMSRGANVDEIVIKPARGQL
jgi:short-subunit dehydrogenase